MPNRKKHLSTLLILCACVFLFTTCKPNSADCTGGKSTRTEGCDQFKRVNSTVYKGSSTAATLPVFNQSGWHPLADGEAISTNSSGMAELNFSACWPGQLFCFQDSSLDFQVATCNQVTYEQTPLACVPNGTIYTNGPCPGEYTINTGSARIIKTGTVLSITYLPERFNVTLVIVLEGSASVDPVTQADPLAFDRPANVETDSFYFTMPDDQLTSIGGLEPRQVYPLPELPPVVEELGIFDWMIAVRDQAQQDDVLPPDWPPELGGSGADIQPPDSGNQVFINNGGGPFTDPRIEDAFFSSVPWGEIAAAVPIDNPQITGFVSGDPVDLIDFPYEPDRSRELLAETGYPNGISVQIFYPPAAPALENLAKLMLRFLPDGGFEAKIREIPDNMDELLARMEESKQGYVILERE